LLAYGGTIAICTNSTKSIGLYPALVFSVVTRFGLIAYAYVGNELSGKGIGASVGVTQYGRDLIKLKRILDVLYENSRFKPSLVAPGGFYEKEWYDKLLQVSGSGIINVLTHHLYNLGPGLLVAHIILSSIVIFTEYSIAVE